MKRSNQVVVVTGASAGVGRAVVRALARDGASLALLARGRAGLAGARREAEELGSRALTIPTDVADADAVQAAVDLTERELGPIDVWINNAMVSVFSPVKEMTAADYRRVTEVTYLGYVHGVLAVLPRMLRRDRGLIVNVGSALAFRGIPLQSAYCAAKHAIQGFTESLRTELVHEGSRVRVTEVHLPAVNTPQFGWVKSRLPYRAQPVPPIHQPEVAAEAILFALDHPRREVWVGWPTVKTIMGNRIAPGYVDRQLADNGFASQQIEGSPDDPDRPHNLWDAVDEVMDYGARGSFDGEATSSTSQLWFVKGRRGMVLGSGLVAGLAFTLTGVRALTERSFPGSVERSAPHGTRTSRERLRPGASRRSR